MVDRFEFTCADCDPDIVSVNHGRWVSYSDYEALRAEFEQIKRSREHQLAETQRAWNERDGEKRRRITAERLAGARVKVKALEWVDLGDGKSFRAFLPIIGSVRVEPYGCCGWWEVLWSMPGHCDKLIPDVFDNPDDAKAAAQADYERRILSALAEPAGEVEPILDQDKVDGWSSTKLALWKVVIDENMNDGHYINAYRFTEKLYEAVTTPPASAIREAVGPDDAVSELFVDAWSEADRAMRKFPQPNYVISKLAEEAGEVVKAAIHCAEGRETAENVAGEIKQAMAMLIRLFVEGDQIHGLPSIRAALAGSAE